MKQLKDYLNTNTIIICRNEEEIIFFNNFMKDNGGRDISKMVFSTRKTDSRYETVSFDMKSPYNCYSYYGYKLSDHGKEIECSEFIINKLEKPEDFIIGEYYTIQDKGYPAKKIIVYNKGVYNQNKLKADYIANFSDNVLRLDGEPYITYRINRLSTPEEIHQLKESIRLNRYVTEEEALKTMNKLEKFPEEGSCLNNEKLKEYLISIGYKYSYSVDKNKYITWANKSFWYNRFNVCIEYNIKDLEQYFNTSPVKEFPIVSINMYEIGDSVEIKDIGAIYTTYKKVFTELGFKNKIQNGCIKGDRGIVFSINRHDDNSVMLSLNLVKGGQVLIGTYGVEKVYNIKYQIEEINKELLQIQDELRLPLSIKKEVKTDFKVNNLQDLELYLQPIKRKKIIDIQIKNFSITI